MPSQRTHAGGHFERVSGRDWSVGVLHTFLWRGTRRARVLLAPWAHSCVLVQGKPAEGVVDLHGVTSAKEDSFGKVQHCISLVTKQRSWVFQAASAAEQKQWLDVVNVSA